MIGEQANTDEGRKAIQVDLAHQQASVKQAIAKDSSVVLLPDNATDAASTCCTSHHYHQQTQFRSCWFTMSIFTENLDWKHYSFWGLLKMLLKLSS